MALAGHLATNKLSGVNSISEFSAGTRVFVPSFNVCPIATAYDQFGRASGYGALNTLTAPGCFSSLETIMNENSLRPVLASNPLYKNIQSGIGGNSGSTLFGAKLPGLAYTYKREYPLKINNAEKCMLGQDLHGIYDLPLQYKQATASCQLNPQNLAGYHGSGKGTDSFRYNFKTLQDM